jgi:hypothetical protein
MCGYVDAGKGWTRAYGGIMCACARVARAVELHHRCRTLACSGCLARGHELCIHSRPECDQFLHRLVTRPSTGAVGVCIQSNRKLPQTGYYFRPQLA